MPQAISPALPLLAEEPPLQVAVNRVRAAGRQHPEGVSRPNPNRLVLIKRVEMNPVPAEAGKNTRNAAVSKKLKVMPG